MHFRQTFIENPQKRLDSNIIPLISDASDQQIINDLEELNDILKDVNDIDRLNLLDNVSIIIQYLYNNQQILQNSDDRICKKLFALIIVLYPSTAKALLQSDQNLYDMIIISIQQINNLIYGLGSRQFTEEIAKWLLQNNIINVCSSICLNYPLQVTYFYLYNDGQINRYITYIKYYTDSEIEKYLCHHHKQLNYDQYKIQVITKEINSYTKEKCNITASNSILLHDLETYANTFIRNGKLNEFKRLYIIMPQSDSIGCWRVKIPRIAKKYFIYKIGIEILVGSALYDMFITANFKLILWLFRIINTKQQCSFSQLPKDILLSIIKLLSCKIGNDINKPIIPGIYCLNKI